MRCPMCGTPSEADAFFCGNCGTSLRAAPTPSDAASWNNANPYVAPTPSDAASWNNANSYAANGALNVGPSFAGAFGYCFAKFCSFKGRATRMEFWGWTVFATLIAVVLDFIFHFAIGRAIETEATVRAIWIILIAEFALSAILRLPTLSVGVRRAHDFGMPMAPVLLYHAISFGCGLTTLLQFAVIPQTYWVVDQDSPLCWLGFALYWLGIVLTLLLGTISGSRGANRYGEKRYNPGSAPSPWENGAAAPNWNAPNAAAPGWNAPNAAPNWNAPNAAPGWNAPNAASNWNAPNADAPIIPGFGEAIKICLSKRMTWQGRASRSEYWWFTLFNILANVLGSILLTVSIPVAGNCGDVGLVLAFVLWIALIVWYVCAGFAGLAVTIRRLHDTDRSGWYFWWVLLPCFGPIILLIFELEASTPGPNRFGPQPINPNAAPNWNAPNAAAPGWNAPNAAPNWNAPNAAPNWNAPNAASNWASSGDEAAEATSLEELLAKLNSLESDEPNVGPSFFGSFAYCWKNCFNFNGRANRTEWWGFHFAVAAPIAAFCYLAISILGIRLDLDEMKLWGLGVFAAALSLPSLALTVRRLHDLGMAGSVLTSKLVEMGIAIVIGVVLAGLARIPVGAIIVAIIVAIQILALWGKIAFAPGTFGFNLYGSRRLNPSDVKQS